MAGGDDDPEGGAGVSSGAPADFFEILGEDEAEILDASPFRVAPVRSPRHGKRGPNRRTVEMRDLYLRSGFTHPMLWQGHMLTMKAEDLARYGEMKVPEALEMQRKIAADLNPYFESKMPTKVQVADEKTPVLVMTAEERRELAHQVQSGAMAIDDDAREQFQRLGVVAREKSYDGGSYDEGQVPDAQGGSGPAAAD